MIIGTKISTKMFFYHKGTNEFSQEISSLGYGANGITSRLYDDACDEGFVLVSERTGAEVPFYLADIEKDNEGDIACWNFKSASNKPKEKDLVVYIFND